MGRFIDSRKICGYAICLHLLIIIFCLQVTVAGQVSEVKTLHSFQSGLPKSQIYDIIQDSMGFIWIGTRDGLLRSDGQQLIWFNAENGLGFNFCKDLFIDRKNNLWIASDADYQGVSAIDLHSMEITRYPYLSDEDEVGKGIVAIDETSDGRIFFLTKNFQLIGLYKDNFIQYNIQSLLPADIQRSPLYDLKIDPHNDDLCWIAGKHGITAYNLNKNEIRSSIVPTNIFSINHLYYHPDHENYLWGLLPFEDGILRINLLDPSDRKIFFPGYEVDLLTESIQEDLIDQEYYFQELAYKSPGELWVTTQKCGLITFHIDEEAYEINMTDFAEFGIIQSVFSNEEGDVWIGSNTHGLRYLTNKTSLIIPFLNEDELIKNPLFRLTGCVQLNKSEYLFGFYNDNHLWKWNSGTGQSDKIIMPEHNWVADMQRIDPDQVLVGTNKDLYIYDLNTNKFTPALKKFPEDKHKLITNIIADSARGGFWVINWTQGLIYWDQKEEWIIEESPDNGLPHSWVHDCLLDNTHRVWVGTEHGLVTIDPEEKSIVHYPDYESQEKNFPNLNFKALALDKEGRIWSSNFGKGLSCFHPDDPSNTFRRFTKSDGLPSDRIFDLITDGSGRIWYWSSEGLGAILPGDHLDSTRIVYYSQTRMLPISRIGTWFIMPNKEEIIFSIIGGWVRFSPDHLIKSLTTPSIPVINDIRLSNDERSKHILPTHINLRPSENFFNINYSSVNYEQPDRIEFAYRMNGIDDDWVFSGNRHEAIYTKMPPGDYEFEVKARFINGEWSLPSQMLSIHLQAPWYRTLAAKTGWTLLILAFLYLIYRIQINRERLKARLSMQELEASNLKAIDQAKSNFFTQISHEFRTPLTVILGMAEQIRFNRDTDFLNKAGQAIHRNGMIVLKHINQILDLTRLQSRHIELDMRNGNIIPYIKYLAEAYHAFAGSRGLDIKIISPESIVMDYDADRVKDILSNLLSNAIKYGDGSGTIIVTCKAVEMNSKPYLLLKVKDSGIGIPSEEIEKIFEPYHQISLKDDYTGSGLGLAISKQWVEAMGGIIEVQSKINVGSSFRVFLPVLSLSGKKHDNTFTKVDGPVRDRAVSGAPYRKPEENELILLVDDHPDVLEYLNLCISPHYRVITAPNGRIALKEARLHVPDVIISDIMMDKMDGFELVKNLKNDLITGHIPVILLTARTRQEEKRLGLKLGAHAYLNKPFDQEELLYQIKNMLVHRQIVISKYVKTSHQDLPGKTSEKDPFLDQVEKFITENIHMELPVEKVASHFHISRIQLYRKIKALTGRSASAHIRIMRLLKGKELLRSTGKSISEVAYEVGFNDPNYFGRTFQEEFNQTPRDFRINALKT